MTTAKLGTLGEIVSWKAPPSMTIAGLRAALNAAGLDPNLARDMLPRNAFSRALTELKVGRVVTPLDETNDEIIFQFNNRVKNPTTGEFEYPKECNVTLRKSSGTVSATDPRVQAAAQTALDEQLDKRTSNDITRLIQSVFDKNKGDLVPLRAQGGVYFVPDSHAHLVESTAQFMTNTGGHMRRFRISDDGSGNTAASVADSMTDHFQGLVAELKDNVAGIDMNAPTAVIQRRVDAIKELKLKLDAYRDILQVNAKTIESDVAVIEESYMVAVGLKEPEPQADAAPEHDVPPAEDPLMALMMN